MIIFNRIIASVAEFWFNEADSGVKFDVVRYVQRPHPKEGIKYSEKLSLVVDLEQDAYTLLSLMSRATRYQIHRAEKEGIQFQSCATNIRSGISDFIRFWNGTAVTQGLAPITERRFREYATADLLEITKVCDVNGTDLVWHIYYRNQGRARMLYSASSFRNSEDKSHRSFIGRANRYHHWRDILLFKDAGMSVYDFGGWYEGNEDEAKLNINKFKEGFGGRIVTEFNQEQALTLKGKAYLFVRGLANLPYFKPLRTRRLSDREEKTGI